MYLGDRMAGPYTVSSKHESDELLGKAGSSAYCIMITPDLPNRTFCHDGDLLSLFLVHWGQPLAMCG